MLNLLPDNFMTTNMHSRLVVFKFLKIPQLFTKESEMDFSVQSSQIKLYEEINSVKFFFVQLKTVHSWNFIVLPVQQHDFSISDRELWQVMTSSWKVQHLTKQPSTANKSDVVTRFIDKTAKLVRKHPNDRFPFDFPVFSCHIVHGPVPKEKGKVFSERAHTPTQNSVEGKFIVIFLFSSFSLGREKKRKIWKLTSIRHRLLTENVLRLLHLSVKLLWLSF